jgi:hypothetical protein
MYSMGERHEHGRIASAWENLMSMEESHRHGRTTFAYKGVNGVNISFFVDFCFGLFFSLSVHQLSPYPDVSFLRLTSKLMYAMFRESSSLSPQRLALSEQSSRVRIK